MSRNVTEIQRRLIALGYLAQGEDDGRFGEKSLDAYNHFRASLGKGPLVQASMAELNADLFPEEQAPAREPPQSIFSKISTILSLINLLKGKTMTADQISGLVRTILASLLAYVAAKGWIPSVSPELLTALTTVVVAVWSWLSNRPKTITPMGK